MAITLTLTYIVSFILYH